MKAFILTCTGIVLFGGSSGITAAVAQPVGIFSQAPTAASSFCWWFPYLPGCPRR